jgi:eukaryotic-like serine/threonine-protein kinase
MHRETLRVQERTPLRAAALAAATAAACVAFAGPARAEQAFTMFRYDAAHTGVSTQAAAVFDGMEWRFKTGGKVRSTPAVADGLAVFGSEDGFLRAVALATGRERWKVNLGGDVSGSPAIAGNRVVILAPSGELRALDLLTGTPLWSFTTGPELPFPGDPRAFDLFLSSPTIAEGVVYVGGGDGKVHAVELATGRPRWAHATGHRVRSSPAVVDGRVFVGSFDGKVYCLDAATGAERWAFATGDAVQASPAVAGGLVFFGSRALALYALDAATGRLVWRRPHSGSWILASAAVGDGKLLIGGSDSHLLECLDARTGAPLWSVDTGARLLGSPTIAGDVVLYGAEDFRAHVADLATGLGLAMEFTEAAVYGSLVLTDGLALVGSDDDHLYAFRTRPAPALPGPPSRELLEAAVGRYRTDAGEEYTLSIHQGRLRIDYCHYPPGLVILAADGSFSCPYLFGMTGRLVREPGRPVSALVMVPYGQEVVAKRVP